MHGKNKGRTKSQSKSSGTDNGGEDTQLLIIFTFKGGTNQTIHLLN